MSLGASAHYNYCPSRDSSYTVCYTRGRFSQARYVTAGRECARRDVYSGKRLINRPLRELTGLEASAFRAAPRRRE